MDPRLKALAAEYEKARSQNEKLRNALQFEKDKNKSYQRSYTYHKNYKYRTLHSEKSNI